MENNPCQHQNHFSNKAVTDKYPPQSALWSLYGVWAQRTHFRYSQYKHNGYTIQFFPCHLVSLCNGPCHSLQSFAIFLLFLCMFVLAVDHSLWWVICSAFDSIEVYYGYHVHEYTLFSRFESWSQNRSQLSKDMRRLNFSRLNSNSVQTNFKLFQCWHLTDQNNNPNISANSQSTHQHWCFRNFPPFSRVSLDFISLDFKHQSTNIHTHTEHAEILYARNQRMQITLWTPPHSW